MRPFFNSFVPRPNQYPQQNLQPNPQQALQHRMQSQIGMMNNPQHQTLMDNRQLMNNNPFVGQLNGLIPNFNQLNPNPQMAQQFYHNYPNVSQQVHPLALPNINQLVPQGAPFFPNFLDGLQFVMANANILGQNLVQSSVDSFQQVQANSSSPHSYPPGQHPNQRLQRPVFTESEGQSIKNVQGGNFGCKGTDFHHENFNKNPKVNVHSQGFQKSRFRHADAGKRTFEMSNNRQGKGQGNKIAADIDQSNPAKISKDKKRSFALVYTAKEIEQWREQRRKSYPSKANVEKKLKGKPTDCGADNDEKMRCQELKEILAKQAELGVEVAEIPSHYLTNANGQATGGEAKGKQFNTSQRFVNNNDTRGKFNKKQNRRGKEYGKREKFGKKRKFQPNDSPSVSSSSTRELTLLEKLLSAEVKKDKNQMLQVCRFMVLNSFFQNCPQQPLKCPLVMIKEHGSERVEGDNSDIKRKIETESSDDDEQAEEGIVKRDEKSEAVSGSGLN